VSEDDDDFLLTMAMIYDLTVLTSWDKSVQYFTCVINILYS